MIIGESIKKSKYWDLLFPKRCPVCDGILDFGGQRICKGCLPKLRKVTAPYCMKCGKQLQDEGAQYCRDCADRSHFYTKGRAMYEYTSVKDSLYRFKYRGRREYGEYYGEQMGVHFKEVIQDWDPDCIIPVPLHSSKLRLRGYNQAEILAESIGKETGINVCKNTIKRIRKTVPQKELNAEKRINNLKKAFKICENDVKLNTIIIIDDIYTTGSTIDEISLAFRQAGVDKIYFIALAIGNGL